MKKKLLALSLAALMTFGALTGCGSEKPEPDAEGTPDASTAQTPELPEASGIDYAAMYAEFAPETVVMTLNGMDITWDIYFYWMHRSVSLIEQYYGELNWEEILESGVTVEEYVRESTESYIKQYWVWLAKAQELNLELDDDDYAELEKIYQEDIMSSGGDVALFEEFCAANFISEKMYNEMNINMIMTSKIFAHYFGEEGKDHPDEAVQEYIDESGVMRAKHILFKTIDDGYMPYDEETVAAQKALADETLEKILACTTQEEMLALFDELMFELTEDPGIEGFPDGYYFVEGEMEENFHAGAAALEVNEVSELVESFFGYHIILRLPIGVDDEVDTYGNSMRYEAATRALDEMYEDWYYSVVLVYSPEFEVSFGEIFK